MTGKASGGGRAWVVAAAGCAVMSCISWTFRCSGLMYVAFLHDFRLTRKQAAWPLALFSIASCLTGPVAGFLAHHVAIRKLCILATLGAAASVAVSSFSCGILQISIWLGVAQGVCCSFHYTLTSPLVASFFDQHITTAMGVLYMGPAIGSFIMIPLFGWSYKEFGLRGAFLIFSGVTLHAVPFLMLMHDPAQRPERAPSKGSQQKGCSLPEGAKYRLSPVDRATHVFRQPMFYVIAVSNVAIGYCNTTVLSVIVDYAIDRGVPEVTAMAILNVANVGDLVGRASFGWITDRGLLSRSQMMFAEYAVLGTLVSTLSGASGPASLIAIVFLYACTTGSVLVLFTNVVKDYLGSQWMPLASGWMMFFGGWTLFTGPPLVGYFRDNVGSYVTMFVFMGLACFSCSALWALVVAHEYWTVLQTRRRQQEEMSLETQCHWKVGVKLRVDGAVCSAEDMPLKSVSAS
ncbi:monocarboxylate transporter 12-like [Amblyomma americanum]